MSTNLEIITDAFIETNIFAAGESIPAADAQLALRRLNQLMAEWKEEGIDLGWVRQDTLGDTAPVPEWAERAVYTSLALQLLSAYQQPVSSTLAVIASEAKNAVVGRLQNLKLQGVDMSHLPLGEWRYDIEHDR